MLPCFGARQKRVSEQFCRRRLPPHRIIMSQHSKAHHITLDHITLHHITSHDRAKAVETEKRGGQREGEMGYPFGWVFDETARHKALEISGPTALLQSGRRVFGDCAHDTQRTLHSTAQHSTGWRGI